MNIFKILKKVFQSLAAVLFLLSIVICGIVKDDKTGALAETAFLTMITAYVGIYVLALVGIFLISATSDTAQKVGHGMTISTFAIGLLIALMNIEDSMAAIIMIIAVIMLALYYLCALVIFIMRKSAGETDDPNEDARIIHIREWKKIMDEGIITQEEFEEKRCHILGIKTSDKKDITPTK